VREAGAGGLRTAIVRPMGMYGDRDPYHAPHILKGARASPWPLKGMLVRIGRPSAALYVGLLGASPLPPRPCELYPRCWPFPPRQEGGIDCGDAGEMAVGSHPPSRFQHVYAGNAAHMELIVAGRLLGESNGVNGETFFACVDGWFAP
jgi:hypothetical protein